MNILKILRVIVEAVTVLIPMIDGVGKVIEENKKEKEVKNEPKASRRKKQVDTQDNVSEQKQN